MFNKLKKNFQVLNDSENWKKYSFSKGEKSNEVKLGFNLRTDKKAHLKGFKELLENALIEVRIYHNKKRGDQILNLLSGGGR